MDIQTVSCLVIAVALLTMLVVLVFYSGIRRIRVENARMAEISGYIHDGAMAYLKRQYRVLSIYAVIMFAVLTFVPGLGLNTALCFVIGALFSVLAGFIGMKGATKANVRTTDAAQRGMREALNIAFTGGSLLGLSVVGMGALGKRHHRIQPGRKLHCPVLQGRRRHLHQGGRRGRGPCGQGGSRHPRGRPAQPGGHRR